MATGWGRLTWGQAGWNEATVLTQGWGALSWGQNEWGDLDDAVVEVTGVSATASLGTSSIAIDVTPTITGLEATASLGTVTPIKSVIVQPT